MFGWSGKIEDMNKIKSVPIRARETTRKDIPRLIELNRAAYPVLAGESAARGEAHLLSDLRVFPRG